MYRVLDPQPKADDISHWSMMYSEYHNSWGLSDPNYDPVGSEFIPFLEGVDPAGITVVKRNNLWFWARPKFYNLSNPKDQVIKTLTPLGIFDDRQLRLIANCMNYQQNDPAGLGCHQANILVSKLYILLDLALAFIHDDEDRRGLVEKYKVVMGDIDSNNKRG